MANSHNLQGMEQLHKISKTLQHAAVVSLLWDLQWSVTEEIFWIGLHRLHLMRLYKVNSNRTFSFNLSSLEILVLQWENLSLPCSNMPRHLLQMISIKMTAPTIKLFNSQSRMILNSSLSLIWTSHPKSQPTRTSVNQFICRAVFQPRPLSILN